MPLLPPIVGGLLVLAGLALLTVAVLGARSRLPRNRLAGVRTAATLRSDAAFTLANRVAAAPLGAAGVVAVAGGAVVASDGPGLLAVVVLAVTAVGMLVLVGLGGMLGDRAALHAAARAPQPSACAGACAGCDAVAGCRDAAPAAPDVAGPAAG